MSLKSKIKRDRERKQRRKHSRTVRLAHETSIIATRGRPIPKSRSERSVFDAPIGSHSAKPDEFYSIVERMYDGPRAEMFARRRRDGWSCYGNEL